MIDIFSKYAWAVPLKNKKKATTVNGFQSIDSTRTPNKIWIDQVSEFYNMSFKKWLDENDIEMYSTHNEGKSVVAERFISTLNNKIYKHMAAVSKNLYLDVLDDIVDKNNNIYHNTIKMKPTDVKSSSYAEYNVDSKDAKFKISNHVRISKYKNIFAKGYVPNCSEVFLIKKVKNTVPWTYAINDLNDKEIVGTFYEKELQKTNQNKFTINKPLATNGLLDKK